MLLELLGLIKSQGAVQVGPLARRMAVSEDQIIQMVEHLTTAGYLEVVDTCKSQGCSHCSQTKACQSGKLHAWRIVKGY